MNIRIYISGKTQLSKAFGKCIFHNCLIWIAAATKVVCQGKIKLRGFTEFSFGNTVPRQACTDYDTNFRMVFSDKKLKCRIFNGYFSIIRTVLIFAKLITENFQIQDLR